MTSSERAAFALELEATFAGELAEDREAAIAEHFGRVPFDVARACIARLVLNGQVFMPKPGELVRALRLHAGGEWQFSCLIAGETSDERSARLAAAAERHNALRAEQRLQLEGGSDE